MDHRTISDAELDTLLAEHDPIDDARLAALDLTVALSQLRESVLTAPPLPIQPSHRRLERRRPRSRRRRLSVAFAVAVAVTVTASLIGFNVFGSGSAVPGWVPTVAPAQAAELNRIAARAAAQPSGPKPGEWLYQRLRITQTGPDASAVTRAVQQWSDNADVTRTRTVAGGEVSTSVLADPQQAGWLPAVMPDTTAAILSTYHRIWLANGAADRRAGLSQPSFGAALFGELSLLMSRSILQNQRAAALRAFAYVPGVQMLGTASDADGRSGLALRYYTSGSTATLIVDLATGDLLQATVAGASTTTTVYLRRAIVGSDTSVPGAQR